MKQDKEQLSQSQEEYLEALYIISKNKKAVRVKDLVNKLHVKSASVIGAIKKLEQSGLVEHEHYGFIDLTEKGRKKASGIYKKHKILLEFLRDILLVNKEIAEKDACIFEHHISNETLKNMISFVNFIKTNPDSKLKDFRNSEFLNGFVKKKKKKEEKIEK